MNFPNGELVRIKDFSWKWNGRVGLVCGQANTLEKKQLVLIDLAPYAWDEAARPVNLPNEIYGIEERFLERVK